MPYKPQSTDEEQKTQGKTFRWSYVPLGNSKFNKEYVPMYQFTHKEKFL